MSDQGPRSANKVCAVCRQPLNERRPMNTLGEFTGPTEYLHVRTGQADHEPVPQPLAEHYVEQLTLFCDFCTSTKVKWSYRADPITGLFLDDSNEVVGQSGTDTDWAACELCARLIERRNRYALLGRAMASGIPPENRDIIAGLHAAFFESRKPGRRRIRSNRT